MRRFIKDKINIQTQSVSRTSPVAMDSVPKNQVDNASVQPPLPLGPPPPPDFPSNTTVKQEREDSEYPTDSVESSPAASQLGEQNRPETGVEKQKICREFVRGACTRPVCRFAHKIDLSQLEGIYTFCRDYQNAKCTFPMCRYVHATIFEEQSFYRTGILPDHTLNHQKSVNGQPMPPPPPLADATPAIPPVLFNQPPPTIPVGPGKPTIIPSTSTNTGLPMSGTQRAMLKREWYHGHVDCVNNFNLVGKNKAAQKCGMCVIMDHRLNFHKEKVLKMVENAEKIRREIELLKKRYAKLNLILGAFSKISTLLDHAL